MKYLGKKRSISRKDNLLWNETKKNPWFFSTIHSIFTYRGKRILLSYFIKSVKPIIQFILSFLFTILVLSDFSHFLGPHMWLWMGEMTHPNSYIFFGSLFSFFRSPFSSLGLCWQDWRMPNGQWSMMPFWNTLPRTRQSPSLPSSLTLIWGWS